MLKGDEARCGARRARPVKVVDSLSHTVTSMQARRCHPGGPLFAPGSYVNSGAGAVDQRASDSGFELGGVALHTRG
jgi:hypothetical protein